MFELDIDRKLDILDCVRAETKTIFEGNARRHLLEMHDFTIATQRHFVWIFAVDDIGLTHSQIARIYAVSRTTTRNAIKQMKANFSTDQHLANNYTLVRARLLPLLRF